ncbi:MULTISPECIES: glycoside hydrolase family 2 TIM barrel-domain containing protein [unclassified Luteococcus]|uniref:glycoside hydrolase family 2 TIM barrel-domain containing protein n=1 Tax=unclassified Luteococcus TaxID=2639923 RepID=UPI00313B9683
MYEGGTDHTGGPYGTELISTAAPARLPARSWRRTEPLRWSLDGQWRFLLSKGPAWAPVEAASPELDDTDWDRIEIPGHWVLQNDGVWGKPAYTNVQFPIPLDPPHVPDENPTGDHRLWITLPGADADTNGTDLQAPEAWVDWQGFEKVLLRLDGVESLGLISVNGTRVGTFSGSRLPLELDVTEHLHPGANLLHIRVHQWSANTYVEDQDQWWLPGIFRSVSLVGRPVAGIDDVWLRADYDHTDATGTITPEVRATEAAYPITLRVPQLGVDVTWQSEAEIGPIRINSVEPWCPETPRLYPATVSNQAEQIELRLGFRTVQIIGRDWLVNGAPVRFRGVNRHEFHPSKGRVFDAADARAGLELMKRHHLNAVRTSHYPPHPELLEMCDELGFWVIDECDLETHGFELNGWVGNPSEDPAWQQNYLDRADRMLERDKNHPSIICWSLGNESGTGANLAAMANQIKRRDPGRPVHYEGDYEAAYSDVVSRMYTSLVEMREMSEGLGVALTHRSAQSVRLAAKPMMLCEYAHAMGNGPGALAEYDEAFNLPGWHGGFVWEWRDHGLLTHTVDGTPFHGYGGDFGERVHDGSFVCDGLLLADGTPSPGLAELAAVNAPFTFALTEDRRLRITNRWHGLDSAKVDFVCTWAVGESPAPLLEAMERGEIRRDKSVRLDVPVIPAGQSVVVSLPDWVRESYQPGSWATIALTALWFEHECAKRSWLAGEHAFELGHARFRLDRPAAPQPLPRPTAAPTLDGDVVRIGPARFDALTGTLTSLGEVAVDACHLELWRAPTENDSLTTFGSYELADPELTHGHGVDGPSSADRWRAAGLDRLHARLVHARIEGDEYVVRERLLPAQGTHGAEVEFRWALVDGAQVEGARVEGTQLDGALRCEVSVDPIGPREPICTWPRIGVHLALPLGYTEARWCGMGPDEAYPDSRTAARHGWWERPIDEMTTPYAVPQESGHRPELFWAWLNGRDLPTLRIGSVGERRIGFGVGRHDAHQLTAATHQHELPPASHTHLYLDAAQHGLGSRSCGPDVLPRYQLWPTSLRFGFTLGCQ